ncbi:MAG: PHP domain-containing protein [Nitrospinota bacterium]
MHVHSTFSTGAMSIDALAGLAEEDGLDVLIMTDHARVSLAWGLAPLRNLLRVQIERPSVFQSGVRKYFDAIAEANRKRPEVLLLPGMEVTAHYHFSGDPFSGNLVAHNWRRHLHVLGLRRPEDFLALPVAGPPTVALLRARGRSAFPSSVWPYLLPGFLFLVTLVGVYLMFRRGIRRALGFLLYLVFLPLTVNDLPFLQPPTDPYAGDPGIRPYQALIDEAVRMGGLALWAHQGSLLQNQKVGPVRLKTPPHPEVLLQSRGYTAFDAIYEDNFVASKPGRQWDLALGEYVQGRRKSPVWAYGGVDFHNRSELRGRKRLSDIQTVLFLKERSETEVLSALQEGRMYVVRGYGPSRLRLDDFSVVSPDRRLMALTGETLTSGDPPEIRFRISASDGSERDLTVLLVRNGEVIQTFRGKTPLRVRYTDGDPSVRGKVYYRLDAKVSRAEHLITNPIFVSRP